MDGFDDLLAPSRRVLEDNPFADPFAKRSGSPDPWASPFANTQPADDYGQTTTPTAGSYSTTADIYSSNSFTSESTTPTPSDPLESAIHTVENDPKVHGLSEPHRSSSAPSPGFRESIEPTFSETATVRTTESGESPAEPHRSSTPVAKAETPRASSPSSSTSSPGQHAKHPSRSDSRVISPVPSTSGSSAEFVSPLERRSTPIGITQSIAGLSLGGESLGGWQSERSAWGEQTDDDSDDDKPISQTVKLPEHGDNKTVSRGAGINVALFPLNIYLQMTTNPPSSSRNENGIQPVFVITVDDPQKVGDPIRSFTMYTVHTRVRRDVISLHSTILTAVSTDNVTVISKIRLFCSSTLFRFLMAIRNSLYKQPWGRGSTSSGEESLRTI